MYVTLYTDVILTHTFSLQGELHTRQIEAGGVCYVVYRCYTHTHLLDTTLVETGGGLSVGFITEYLEISWMILMDFTQYNK